MYKKEHFGVIPTGEPVDRYTLYNKNGVSASFISLGGIWTSLIVPDRDGRETDVLLGYDTVDACLQNGGHLGEIVGRNANRIGQAKLTIDGKVYPLVVNNGPNNLHSGPDFYRNRIWDAEIAEHAEDTSISFSLMSPDGDQGYPGNAQITVTYTLTADNAVEIRYNMICDHDTIANMTNHSYFNLAGHNTGNAMAQQVWINADFYTPTDSDSIPTGILDPVQGTPMDFTVMKPIERDINCDFEPLRFGSGYDHNWVLNNRTKEPTLAAKAYDAASGRWMEVYTDLPGLQFYTANFLESQIPGKSGVIYGSRHGYCFETQYYPNAVNIPAFPSPILKEGKEYKTITIYKFLIDGKGT
ncbi:MAG: aldose epimerase family protein [Clostridium sp.]